MTQMCTDYDFKLCTTEADLHAAYKLRLEVFHEEQKFSKDTEVDRLVTFDLPIQLLIFLYFDFSYDPISAHFIVTSRKDNTVVATVRLVPYFSVNQVTEVSNVVTIPENAHILGGVRSESEIVKEFHKPECIGIKLGRMAVREMNRRKGVGAMTVRNVENWIVQTFCGRVNLSTVILSSQMQAKGFYEKMGYVSHGEPYDEEGMLHILCQKELSLG